MGSPQVSVILCTYNRAALLRQTLTSLGHQSLPENWSVEFIIMDNNSSDHTASVAMEFVNSDPARFRYLFESQQGKSFALNTGIKAARGEILAFTDDDVTLDPNWLKSLVEGFRRFDCLGVGGRILPIWEVEKPEWLRLDGPYKLMAAIVSFDLGDEAIEIKRAPFGANMAFNRAAFEKYGLFRTDLGPNPINLVRGEDTEFCRRLIKNGETLVYLPKALVYHPVEKIRVSKEYYLSWYLNYGKAVVRENGSNSYDLGLLGLRRGLVRNIVATSVRWALTVNSQERFYYKLNFFMLLGVAAESLKLQKRRRLS